MHIGIAIPNNNDFRDEMVATLALLAWHLGKKGHDLSVLSAQGCYIDQNRNKVFEIAKNAGVDYLFFIDADVGCAANADFISQVIDTGKDIVTGVYYQGKFPHRPVIYTFTEEKRKILNFGSIPGELFPVDACGGGFLLISKKVLDAFTPETMSRIGKPFDYLFEGSTLLFREDVAFCRRVKELGFQIWADPSIRLTHIKDAKITRDFFETAKAHLQQSPMDNPGDGGIEGWMTAEELAWLSNMAAEMKSVAEIGSWKGRSTKALADHCTGTVYAVDHWQGSEELKDLAHSQDVFAQFMRNVGNAPNLTVMKMPSLEAAQRFEDSSVDMVFIDAGHDYESVKADIAAWHPKAKKLICGHDYCEGWPGVVRAVTEAFGDVKVAGTIWYKEIGQ